MIQFYPTIQFLLLKFRRKKNCWTENCWFGKTVLAHGPNSFFFFCWIFIHIDNRWLNQKWIFRFHSFVEFFQLIFFFSIYLKKKLFVVDFIISEVEKVQCIMWINNSKNQFVESISFYTGDISTHIFLNSYWFDRSEKKNLSLSISSCVYHPLKINISKQQKNFNNYSFNFS